MKMLAKIETLRRFVLMTVLAAMSMFVVSCSSSDDDDPVPAYDDFYIEFSCSGGGFTQQELTQMTTALNSQFADETMEGYSKDQAIYVFDSVVKSLKQSFRNGSEDVVGTLNLTLVLKTTDGKVVKRSTLYITNSGVS